MDEQQVNDYVNQVNKNPILQHHHKVMVDSRLDLGYKVGFFILIGIFLILVAIGSFKPQINQALSVTTNSSDPVVNYNVTNNYFNNYTINVVLNNSFQMPNITIINNINWSNHS